MTDHGPSIDIHYFEEEELKFNDLLVVVTHPTIGTISSIVGNYLVEHLDLRLVGAFLSADMFPAAVIREGHPQPPVRIYAGEYKDDPTTDFDQLVVIASDLPMERQLMYALSDRIIEWAKFNKARAILTIEAINREEMSLASEVNVFTLTTGHDATGLLSDVEVAPFDSGMVSGMTGLLQYKGKIAKFPVISFLSEAHEKFPDSRSAAAVLSKLNKLLPKIEIDYAPLLKQAELVEAQILQALSQISQPRQQASRSSSSGMFA